MSRILFINSVCNGSTGTIMKNLYQAAEMEGHDCCIAYGRGNAPKGFNTIKIGNQFDIYMHVIKARVFDSSGFGSRKATIDLIKKIELYNPDIIHLHNIHGYYINIEILFSYLKKRSNIKKIWTLHDCWSYTGHCAFYTYAKCSEWKIGCNKCKQKEKYPKTFFSFSKKNYEQKKHIFCNVANMSIITVSNWLNIQVRDSFLQNYYVQTITNGLNNNQYESEIFSSKYQEIISLNKKIILGVASTWEKRKGYDTFTKLSTILSDDYQIVLVGLNKKQIRNLPKKIIGIKRTNNLNDLLFLYKNAYVFFNPTEEETFGMTNIEAQLMGTPVITYNSGGTPETIKNSNCYIINNKLEEFLSIINNVSLKHISEKQIKKDLLINNDFVKNYLLLYRNGK